ncbi:MAG: hypothetical protein F4Y02_03580 [Chloroflexi bacterium]|nr:hypothetical protein [Chloroflexota bacterium]
MAEFPVVDATGSPYEVGRVHGAAVAGMVRAEVEARLGGQDRDVAFRYVADVQAFVKDWAPHLLDEVRGIADGAGIDQRAALWLQWGTAAPDVRPEECTSFAVGPEFTGDGTVYAGLRRAPGPGAMEMRCGVR